MVGSVKVRGDPKPFLKHGWPCFVSHDLIPWLLLTGPGKGIWLKESQFVDYPAAYKVIWYKSSFWWLSKLDRVLSLWKTNDTEMQRHNDAKKDNWQLEVGEGDRHRKEQIQREKLSYFSGGTVKIDKDPEYPSSSIFWDSWPRFLFFLRCFVYSDLSWVFLSSSALFRTG